MVRRMRVKFKCSSLDTPGILVMSAIPRVVLGESCEFLRTAQAVLMHTRLELLDGDGFRQVAGLEIFSPALEKEG
jgi:hypothetical protein